MWLGDAADDVPAQGPAVLVVGADGTAAPDRAGLLVLPKPFCAEELLAALTAGETA